MKRVVSILIAFLVIGSVVLTGCEGPGKIYTSDLFAMNTIMELQIAGNEDHTAEAEEIIRALEKELSVTDEGSSIYRLNETGECEVPEQVAEILQRTLAVCERTDGALDITIYPVLKAWGFTTSEYRVPSEEEIAGLLEKVGYGKISVSGEKIKIPEGAMVDLGSVVKGYTGTCVADYLRGIGVTHALLNLGGNVQCIGTKPDGNKWKVAIKSPFEDSASGIFGVIEADDIAIITSGGYERYFEENGEIYWHILDPKTGKPAKSGLASATVIGKDGLVCDGLSTALFVMGLDKAIEMWRESNDFETILITEDGEVYVTEGIAGKFTLGSEYRNSMIHIIKRTN